jgi:hypothetical protein
MSLVKKLKSHRFVKNKSSFSLISLTVFMLVFGSLGAYFLFRSFASPSTNITYGDLDGNGSVTIIDMSILLSNFGTNHAVADVNGDGTVDNSDLDVILDHYNTQVPSDLVTNPPITDNTSYNNAIFTHRVNLDNHHNTTFSNSTFLAGMESDNGSPAHDISLVDSDITNPSNYCVKMSSLDSDWSFLRVKIHDCGSMGIVWNRDSPQPPQTQWGHNFSFIGGEVWNTGLNDGEHAFYLNVRDVHIAGSKFHDFKNSAISLRFGGALVEFNDFTYSRAQDAVTYYEYDGTAYKNITLQRNKVFGSNGNLSTDFWIGTSEGPQADKNRQSFIVTNNCFPKGSGIDPAISPKPSLTVSNNNRCSDTGAAFWSQ